MNGSILRCVSLSSILLSLSTFAQVPQYELDLQWPRIPMGDNWLTGGIGGMCIDRRDHVYLLNRQNVVDADLDGAKLAPPIICLLYTSPSPRDSTRSRMPSSA